jgi:hypothetical protein
MKEKQNETTRLPGGGLSWRGMSSIIDIDEILCLQNNVSCKDEKILMGNRRNSDY